MTPRPEPANGEQAALQEALEREAATREILHIISRSRDDEKPVLEAIARTVLKLCGSELAAIWLAKDDAFVLGAHTTTDPELARFFAERPVPTGRASVAGRALLERRPIHVDDMMADPELSQFPQARQSGTRSILAVPLITSDSEAYGVITVSNRQLSPFTPEQITLVETFAAQAVIAIENARQFAELAARNKEISEALEHQTATSEILGVISSSPTDVQPVFDIIARNAARLCSARLAVVLRIEDGLLEFAAGHGLTPEAVEAQKSAFPMPPDRGSAAGRAITSRALAQIPDVEDDPDYRLVQLSALMAARSVSAAPMLRDDVPIGAIAVLRDETGLLPERQAQLLKTFADQAVIAIENVRLFNELGARNHDLTDALERQTATGKVLGVISRSNFELQPVLDTIVETAAQLCHAEWAVIHRLGEDGRYYLAADARGNQELLRYLAKNPVVPGRGKLIGRTALEGRVVHLTDVLADPEYEWRGAQERGGYRTVLGVPLLREGTVAGVITLARNEVKPFTNSEIELVATFADQAVIAMENARLFKELRESLEQQTATADVLTAISRTTFDLPTVLKTLVEAAARLCEADQGTIAREQDGQFRRVASYGYSSEFDEAISTLPVERDRASATGRALSEGRIVHIPDIEADPEYTFALAKKLGRFRTVLAVPMLREGGAIGVIAVTRKIPRPFTQKQIDLVTTFADQAAIAIDNVRLFESAEARARELARSLDELRVTQDRLVQTEKLASLGQLTAGIAHEIKNPLNFVTNFASLSTELIDDLEEGLRRASLADDDRDEIDDIARLLRGNLEKIRQHGRRADSIVKNMLQHARRGTGEHRRIDINSMVDESLNLAFHGARAETPGFEITLERRFDEAAGEADVYAQEVTRVLLNLIANGFYATTQRKKAADSTDYAPTLTIATRDRGDRVEISVRDNGTGMPPHVKDQLFSPFFTTKPAGEGTGLGLSISHDIVVKQHAGSIEVESEPGAFTEFRILLPRAMTDFKPAAP